MCVVSTDSDVKLAVECLDCMMRKRRQVSIQRVLGFVKRLSTLTPQFLPGACLAFMATIKRFIQVSTCMYIIASVPLSNQSADCMSLADVQSV